jgi:nucleotide-binding universal stress UspA family protein
MTPPKILCPTDFSASSTDALPWAEALAGNFKASLILLHVEPGQPTSEFGSIYKGLPDPGISEIARDLAKIVPRHKEIPFEHRIRAGDPAAEILAEARDQDVMAIVIGSHGRSGVRRLLLGSVAEAVLRKAHCPVVICKMKS